MLTLLLPLLVGLLAGFRGKLLAVVALIGGAVMDVIYIYRGAFGPALLLDIPLGIAAFVVTAMLRAIAGVIVRLVRQTA